MPTKTKKKKVKAKQQEFEAVGMKRESIQEIDACADRYVEARDERLAVMKVELAEKSSLMQLMKSHDLKTYRYDGKLIEIKSKDETVKVTDIMDDDSVDVVES